MLSWISSLRTRGGSGSGVATMRYLRSGHAFLRHSAVKDNDETPVLDPSHPYYTKYASKIERAKKEGKLLTNTVEVGSPALDIDKLISSATEEATVDPTMEKIKAAAKPKLGIIRGKYSGDEVGQHGGGKLDDLVKVELLEKHTPEEVTMLWKAYLQSKACVGAVIEAETWGKLLARSIECPLFILPMPRPDGIEFFYVQWSGLDGSVAFTSLGEFKLRQDMAKPFLVLKHHKELLQSKGLVLMAGHVGDGMKPIDAQFLVNQLQIYYNGKDEAYELVKVFNQEPSEFDFNILLNRLTSLTA